MIFLIPLFFAVAASLATTPGTDAPAFGKLARVFGRRGASSSGGDRGESPSDNCLERLRRGDESAAAELVAEFEGPLVRYFRTALPDAELAEDAAQEVFVRVIGSLRGGKMTKRVKSPKAFIFTIARRLALDVRKSVEARHRKLSLDEEPDSDRGVSALGDRLETGAPDPRRLAAASEETGLVAEALEELDPQTREIIVLRLVEGLSAKEVGEIVGVAEGTVWSRQNRGLAALRDKLAPQLQRG